MRNNKTSIRIGQSLSLLCLLLWQFLLDVIAVTAGMPKIELLDNSRMMIFLHITIFEPAVLARVIM